MTRSVRKADNLLIKHYPGFLLQENHYYPFGLLNKALSSDEQKGFHQRYGFNGKEFENGLDWRVNDFGARMYDPVLGRWGRVDPKAHERVSLSTYNYCSNDPINRVDPTGAIDEWVKSNSKGEYEWMDNVTSAKNTPVGYSYVGTSGSDILKDINPNFGSSQQSQTSSRIGYIAADVEEGKYAVNHMINVREKSAISISADVSFNLNNKAANNSMGRTFNGITVSSTIISSNSELDGSMNSGAALNVSYCGKAFMSSFEEPAGAYIKATGTSVNVASLSIPASSITKNAGLSANVSGGWWITNSANLPTPVVYHPLVPIPQSFSHKWSVSPVEMPIPKNKHY